MRSQTVLSFIVLVAGSVARAATPPRIDSAQNTIPGAFIVELSAPSASKRAGLGDVHGEFLGELNRRAGGRFTTNKKYASPIFNGVAVQLHTPEELVDLASMPNVVAVRPVFIVNTPKLPIHVATGPDDPAVYPVGQSPHIMTGVDRVHAQGFTGKGIKIGIIDTGVDYRHPALGGGFGPGFKFVGGHDFVGDDYMPGLNLPAPDKDPLESCGEGHGTHVAGILSANPGNQYNVTGVAYDAEMYAYRVFSCSGASSEDIIIAAMLRAYDDGMDVINMSIGSPSGWSDATTALVAQRIGENGRVISFSAGNDGDLGAMTIGTPATGDGPGVIAAASVENIAKTFQTFLTSLSSKPIARNLSFLLYTRR